jgi:hypothetical protein
MCHVRPTRELWSEVTAQPVGEETKPAAAKMEKQPRNKHIVLWGFSLDHVAPKVQDVSRAARECTVSEAGCLVP